MSVFKALCVYLSPTCHQGSKDRPCVTQPWAWRTVRAEGPKLRCWRHKSGTCSYKSDCSVDTGGSAFRLLPPSAPGTCANAHESRCWDGEEGRACRAGRDWP